MTKISPQSITLKALKAGEYSDLFPQFYALKEVEENSAYHDHQKVYDHAVSVLESLQTLFQLDFVSDSDKKLRLQTYLAGKPANVSRQTLIFLATICHDIGKEESLIETSPGNFGAPAHELLAIGYAKEYLEKLALSELEKEWIYSFITAHGYVHGLIDIKLKRTDQDFFPLYRKSVGDLDFGLLFFVYADLLGSDLKKADPEDFAAKTAAVKEMIGWI